MVMAKWQRACPSRASAGHRRRVHRRVASVKVCPPGDDRDPVALVTAAGAHGRPTHTPSQRSPTTCQWTD